MPFALIDNRLEAPERSGAFRHSAGEAPALALRLWPNRSLPPHGFVAFIALSSALLALPLIATLGTPALWGLLPFVALAIAAIWYALRRNHADGQLTEELTLWADRIAIVRDSPRGPRQEWQANPHWVRVELHPSGGPVENYLTLRGGGRVVELGAFLSPNEREELCSTLKRALSRLA